MGLKSQSPVPFAVFGELYYGTKVHIPGVGYVSGIIKKLRLHSTEKQDRLEC